MKKIVSAVLSVFLIAVMLLTLTGCGNSGTKVEPTAAPTEAPAATDAPADETASAGNGAQDFSGTTLTVFNCFYYIDPAVIELFEQETGAKVDYVNYTTNEEMYTKLEAGAANYDIIFPSDYMIERLIKEDRLEPLNMANIPNREGLIEWLKTADYPATKYACCRIVRLPIRGTQATLTRLGLTWLKAAPL